MNAAHETKDHEWIRKPLGQLCSVSPGGTPSRAKAGYWDGDIPWVKISDMLQGIINSTDERISRDGLENSPARLLPAGTLLLSIFATIGRTAVLGIEAATNQAIVGLSVKDKKQLDLNFLRRFLELKSTELKSQGHGVAQSNINGSILKALPVPLPPIEEQRTIAETLNRADALRAKRRSSLAQLDSLTQSLFLDLFGDPSTNPKGWPSLRLEETLTIPLRNGLSPSHTGKVAGNVLTLSAITGKMFNETARKVSTFQTAPPPNQTVDENDFLICRGNGNLHMVGKGYFPSRRMSDVAFPDTMIAARVSCDKVERAFLQYIWNSLVVRKQIESLARTTNGTFKVNQTMLEGITFVAPPLQLQREFARRVHAIENLKKAHLASLAELDALFASLQHRAFRGEL